MWYRQERINKMAFQRNNKIQITSADRYVCMYYTLYGYKKNWIKIVVLWNQGGE